MKKLGLLVNPLAGIGGRVGLKGSDGDQIVRRAFALGAECLSPRRASEALASLLPLADDVELLTYPGPMGEEEALQAGFHPLVIGALRQGRTSAADTRRAAGEMIARGADLLLFAGGDGTARDVHDAVGRRVAVLGIPTGCKIHSAVFAADPPSAGELARLFLEGRVTRTAELEVMDIDEEAFRNGEVHARLYGYLNVPCEPRLTQGAKTGGGCLSEEAAVSAIAERVVEDMEPGRLYMVGSGTTPRGVMKRLALPHTLLGIDVVRDGRLLAADASEKDLLFLLRGTTDAGIIVTPVGGQGYIFGRGNQQLSPEVIRRVGAENVQVIATPAKLVTLPFHRLRVDTTDPAIDQMLRGYRRVITSYRESAVVEVV